MKSTSKAPLRLLAMLLALQLAAAAHAKVVTATIDGLEIGIDEATGSLVSLRSPHTGLILEAPPERAGLLDLGYPVESFPPMRLASRFSKAQVVQAPGKVTIKWEHLGPSRPNLAIPSGAVRAEVAFRSAGDGRSVILEASIENGSGAPVPQILFPDLWGMKPVYGPQQTRLRLARDVILPFAKPVQDPEATPFYASGAHGSGIAWKEYKAGSYYNENALRWLDYGGASGGLSVFQKKWGTADWPNVMTQRTERDPMSLRLVWEHQQTIEPGKSWHSGEFWLTPHPGGWAKGIEVFRNYVHEVVPPKPLPKHVAEDVAYQTIWMIQTAELDPGKAVYRFQDLPRIAADAKKHDIHELVLWGWNTYSTLPIPVRPELGTVEDLQKAVKEARAMGVNISPFISISILRNMYADRYGVTPANDDWTYHAELIPNFRPYYTRYWNGVEIDANNEIWRSDTYNALKQWIDRGVSSFAWDVFRVSPAKNGGTPPVLSLVSDVRKLARAENPQSTFSAESVTHMELDALALDYLWNWTDYEDAGPMVSVLPAPRIACNVEASVLVVAKCFTDGLYINAMPRQLDSPNGTALISERSALSAALIRASALRKQFLPYFTQGTFIGDSVTSLPSESFVRGYQLRDKMLVIVVNDGKQPTAATFRSDLSQWLPKAKGYSVTRYDGVGKSLGTAATGTELFATTEQLEPGELAFFEVTSAR
jgi:hypothetical protein